MRPRDEVTELLHRAAWAVDAKDPQLYAGCLAEDATFRMSVPEGDRWVQHGRHEIVEASARGMRTREDQRRHVLTNIAVLEEAPDRVRTRSYLLLLSSHPGGRTQVLTAGVYDDVSVLVDEEWTLHERHLTCDGPI